MRPALRLKQKTHSIIPLNDLAIGLLRRLRAEANASPFVFPGDRPGQPLKSIVRPWHQMREAAKLEHVRIHDLRHVFATLALEGGASLDEIAPLLGHASTVMTKTYAHFSAEALRAATRKAARLLARHPPRPWPSHWGRGQANEHGRRSRRAGAPRRGRPHPGKDALASRTLLPAHRKAPRNGR